MKIIGLLGGVASGKSIVAEKFRNRGAVVLDADRAGHEVLRLAEVQEAVRRHFGPEVFTSEGAVDRKALARIVFAPSPAGPRELLTLEKITHPEIRRRLIQQIQQATVAGSPAAILDAPVMLKSGWDRICDVIAFVDCPETLRRSRAVARGWSEKDFSAREASQESIEAKRARADFVIDNSGSLEYTETQIERLWHSLVG